MTRRQRIDLALLLIIRRAEREASVLGQSSVVESDVLTASISPGNLTKHTPLQTPH
jgi:hypothetical protein